MILLIHRDSIHISPNLKNTVRLYPILSPSELQIKLNIFDHDGNEIKEYDIDSLSSPSD